MRRLVLVRGETCRELPLPPAGAATVATGESCACGAELHVRGTGARIAQDGRAWEADAVAACCEAREGVRMTATNLARKLAAHAELAADEHTLQGVARIVRRATLDELEREIRHVRHTMTRAEEAAWHAAHGVAS